MGRLGLVEVSSPLLVQLCMTLDQAARGSNSVYLYLYIFVFDFIYTYIYIYIFFFPKASAMLGFSFRRLREERDRMSGSGGRAVDELWTGGSCRNSMGGG